jgi:phytoene dehydrogenase-like protein
LVRGLRAHGGKLLLNSPVASVLEGPAGRAAGVVLRGGTGSQRQIRARRAVVSNASLFDTQRLVPEGQLLPEFRQQVGV